MSKPRLSADFELRATPLVTLRIPLSITASVAFLRLSVLLCLNFVPTTPATAPESVPHATPAAVTFRPLTASVAAYEPAPRPAFTATDIAIFIPGIIEHAAEIAPEPAAIAVCFKSNLPVVAT